MLATDDGSNVTRETVLEFIEEYRDVDAAVAEAVGHRKDLRARIKGAGIRLRAFDRARKDSEMSGEQREADDREYRRYLAFIGKPLGYQSGLFETEAEEEDATIPDMQRQRVRQAGAAAANTGASKGRNPWSPGTPLAAEWDAGWDDAAARIEAEGKPAAAAAAANGAEGAAEPTGTRRRGRPPGARDGRPRTRRRRDQLDAE